MRHIIIVFAFLIISIGAMAQIHTKGISGIEFGGGKTGKGWYGNLAYSKYFSSRFYMKANFNYESGTISSVKFQSYYLDIMPTFTLFNISEVVFFNAVVGLSGAYENAASIQDAPSQSGVIYGGLVGGEAEIFVNEKFAFVLNANQRYYLNSKFNSNASPSGSSRYFLGVGFKFMF